MQLKFSQDILIFIFSSLYILTVALDAQESSRHSSNIEDEITTSMAELKLTDTGEFPLESVGSRSRQNSRSTRNFKSVSIESERNTNRRSHAPQLTRRIRERRSDQQREETEENRIVVRNRNSKRERQDARREQIGDGNRRSINVNRRIQNERLERRNVQGRRERRSDDARESQQLRRNQEETRRAKQRERDTRNAVRLENSLSNKRIGFVRLQADKSGTVRSNRAVRLSENRNEISDQSRRNIAVELGSGRRFDRRITSGATRYLDRYRRISDKREVRRERSHLRRQTRETIGKESEVMASRNSRQTTTLESSDRRITSRRVRNDDFRLVSEKRDDRRRNERRTVRNTESGQVHSKNDRERRFDSHFVRRVRNDQKDSSNARTKRFITRESENTLASRRFAVNFGNGKEETSRFRNTRNVGARKSGWSGRTRSDHSNARNSISSERWNARPPRSTDGKVYKSYSNENQILVIPTNNSVTPIVPPRNDWSYERNEEIDFVNSTNNIHAFTDGLLNAVTLNLYLVLEPIWNVHQFQSKSHAEIVNPENVTNSELMASEYCSKAMGCNSDIAKRKEINTGFLWGVGQIAASTVCVVQGVLQASNRGLKTV